MKTRKSMQFAVIDQAVRSWFHADLARFMRAKYGIGFHLYSQSALSLEVQRTRYADTYDSYILIDKGELVPAEPKDAKTICRRIAYYEDRYGIPFGWFRLCDRHMGLGFSPGGFYHPRSLAADTASDLAVNSNYLRQLDFWEREIRERNLDVIINGYQFEYFPAHAQGCHVRSSTSARNENYYFWAENCHGELHGLAETYSETKVPNSLVELEDAPILNRKQLDKISERASFSNLVKRLSQIVIRQAYQHYKRDGSKHYLLSSELGHVWRDWRALRKLYAQDLPSLAELKARDYVYYALQVEPEINFQGYSPEYFYQHSAIISLARDLPLGMVLAVKEHLPAAGRRPDRFHDQIRLLKNVVFMDVRESGLELARNAKAVATINGTVGQEAAIMGKPVITFGRHNLYNILPHVKLVEREEDLHPSLLWALSDSFDHEQAKEDGQRYLEALRTHSFDMEDFGFHNPKGYSDAVIERAAQQLMASLPEKQLRQSRSTKTKGPAEAPAAKRHVGP